MDNQSIRPQADLPTMVMPLVPRLHQEKGEPKKGHGRKMQARQQYCHGTRSQQGGIECRPSLGVVTSDWDVLEGNSRMVKGSVVDLRDIVSQKGLRLLDHHVLHQL
jgi:hypothetical protein